MFNSKRQIAVRTIGDPVLSRIAEPVLTVDADTVRLAAEMIEAMRVFNGIGLAAPQYGVSKRLVVIDVPAESVDGVPTPGEEMLIPRMPLVLVNPEIISYSTRTASRDEGCLSVPDVFAPVERPEKVVLRSATLNGDVIECECGGLLACCIQHELDHLDGKLFTDRLAPEVAREVAGELKLLVRNGAKRSFQRVKKIK